jgi:hypothetical protein
MSFRVLGIITAGLLASVAAADFVFFLLDPSEASSALLIEGVVDTRNSAQMLTLRHQKYGELILPRNQCKWFKAEDPAKKRSNALKAAVKMNDNTLLWKLAKESIRRGSAGNYFRAAEIIGETDPDHEEAARARRLAAMIDASIPESEDEIEAMKKNSKVTREMKFERSEHFLLMHNLPASKRVGSKATRARERLDIMEKVYKAYLAFFWSRGMELAPPKERLHIVLFEREDEFKENANEENPSSASANGYFDRKKNVSFFYEFRGTPEFRSQKKDVQSLIDVGKERNVANRGDFVRLGKALNVALEIGCEQADVKVCSHEITHHLSQNTGLMPFNLAIPLWMAEGFATYFESPRDAQWSGIGAVNEERLAFYRKARRSNHAHCNVKSIVTDRIWHEAKTKPEKLNAYSVTWAFTHFLMERHFDRLMLYYKKAAKLPLPKYVHEHEEQLEQTFNSCFTPQQLERLDTLWHAYMTSLKTDFEEIAKDVLFKDGD